MSRGACANRLETETSAVSSRILGRLEQQGRRGQQLPVHLRHGQPLRHRLAVSLPVALTLAAPWEWLIGLSQPVCLSFLAPINSELCPHPSSVVVK